jgi:predicted Holliday junction resolvase-like endonuclease
MNTAALIEELRRSALYAECPCGGEFKLARALMFDGTKPFPPEAMLIQQRLKKESQERMDELKRQRHIARTRPAISARSSNIGKSLEKILPAMKDFKWNLPDTKFLGEPLDLIIFNGLSKNSVSSIDFVEIKSGKGRLNDHQQSIKEAIERKKVSCEVFR